MHIDKWGLIFSGGDGGDTLCRQYTFLLRKFLIDFKVSRAGSTLFNWPVTGQVAGFMSTSPLLEREPGIYRRNADESSWTSDPRNVSRDQLVPVICYLATRAYSYESPDIQQIFRRDLKNLLVACLKRWMFAQNTLPNWFDPRKAAPATVVLAEKTPDFITPDLWATFARGWMNTRWAPLALLVILFGDACHVISVLLKLFGPKSVDGTLKFSWPGPNDVDDDNMHNVIMTNQYTFSTPFSWLARKIFKKFRKDNYGNLGDPAKVVNGGTPLASDAVSGALGWYHRLPDGNPELAEMAQRMVEKY